ncbi:hypothetical protein LCGC14_0174340 [marine sediment metagenome]|uniref:Uncharacterized protein n=1 Tax=marine sediment metagenome TaxID=412755 RepID=A0A0F9X9B3_9ZZZZ
MNNLQLDKVAFLSFGFLILQIWEHYPFDEVDEFKTMALWVVLFVLGSVLLFLTNSLRSKDPTIDPLFYFIFGAMFGTIGQYYLGYYLSLYLDTPLWVYNHPWIYSSPLSIVLWGIAGVLFIQIKKWVEN